MSEPSITLQRCAYFGCLKFIGIQGNKFCSEHVPTERTYTEAELNAAKVTAAGAQREACARHACANCEANVPVKKFDFLWKHEYSTSDGDRIYVRCFATDIRNLPLTDEAEKWLQEHDAEVTRKADELTIQQFIKLLGSKDNTFPLKFCNKGIGVALDKYLTNQLAEARAEAYRRCAEKCNPVDDMGLSYVFEQWATEAGSQNVPRKFTQEELDEARAVPMAINAYLLHRAAELRKNAAARRDAAKCMDDVATAEDLLAAHGIAEKMANRKLPRSTVKNVRQSAEIDERIAAKYEAEAMQLEQWATSVEGASHPGKGGEEGEKS